MTPDPHEEVKDQRQYIPARASIVFYQRLRVLLPPPSPSSPDQHHNHNSSSGGAGPKRHSQTSSALTVRLLEPGTGTLTTELLGLAAAVVGDEEGTVELGEGLLEQVLGVLIDELLVVGDQGLGDCLSDGVDLRSVTTTGDTDTDVEAGELVKTNDEQGLVDLGSENGRLDQLERSAIDLDQTLSGLAVGDSRRVLLLAEALNHLCRRHFYDSGWIVGGLRGRECRRQGWFVCSRRRWLA